MTATESWSARHQDMRAAWVRVERADETLAHQQVEVWSSRIASMRSRQSEFRRRGQWRGGPRSLLAALNVQFRELTMTAAFAWSLRPDGHHGLGDTVLRGLLEHLGITASTDSVRIVLEETRDRTRADLVLYGDEWTVVVEAKTFASEQQDQLDRLFENWRDEPGVDYVFLTPGVRTMRTAEVSKGRWRAMTWGEVAQLIRAATRDRPEASPGILDYLDTLEAYYRA